MTELQLKNRHHLRKRESKKIISELEDLLGMELKPLRSGSMEMAETDEYELIIVGDQPVVFMIDSHPFLTLKGFLALGDDLKSAKKFITVDKGAVRFVSNGADIMVPGIVDTDPGIEKGDLVWVRDEAHFKPLGVGEALMSAEDIKNTNAGKAVRAIHYVGDNLWGIDV